MSQGVLNGQITRLANNPDALRKLMADKTDEQKRQGRIHLKMIHWLRDKK